MQGRTPERDFKIDVESGVLNRTLDEEVLDKARKGLLAQGVALFGDDREGLRAWLAEMIDMLDMGKNSRLIAKNEDPEQRRAQRLTRMVVPHRPPAIRINR